MVSLSSLLKAVFDQNASDLHITAGSPPKVRIKGDLFSLDMPKLSPEEAKNLCFQTISEQNQKKFLEEKELDFSFSVKGLCRFRGNLFFQRESVSGVFRVIPTQIPRLSDLGFPNRFLKLTEFHSGLVLVTGATGSGKSTTLASLIDHINENEKCHIITLEDPIEYVHSHKKSIVNQREVGGDTKSFHEGMKHLLRQDPDVILIGELRDKLTIELALQAAETGHLVFGTLHTNSAVSSILRLIGVFSEAEKDSVRQVLSQTLRGVLSQKLIVSNQKRIPAYEYLDVNFAVQNLIREGKIHQIPSSMQSNSDSITLNKCLSNFVAEKKISKEIAIAQSDFPDELLALI